MHKSIKFVCLFLLIAISSFTSSAQNVKPVSEKVTIKKEKSTTKNETFYVDVRTPTEFAQGSVKEAVNIPLDQIEKQLAKFKNKKSIVVFCRSGNRSSQAKVILEQNGFTNVTNGGTWEDVKAKLKK